MTTKQARMFEHEDLPLFSGAAPCYTAAPPKPTPEQADGLPMFATSRPIFFFNRDNGDKTLSGEDRRFPAGTKVAVRRYGGPQRILVVTPDGWLAWVHNTDIEIG